jgi:hypothetical protein
MLRWTSTAHRAASTAPANSSGRLDDAAAMLGDGRTDQRFSERLELRQRALLVPAH